VFYKLLQQLHENKVKENLPCIIIMKKLPMVLFPVAATIFLQPYPYDT
jgi:hypothetical protein